MEKLDKLKERNRKKAKTCNNKTVDGKKTKKKWFCSVRRRKQIRVAIEIGLSLSLSPYLHAHVLVHISGFESSLCCAIRDNNLNLLSDLLRDSAEIRKALKEKGQWERKALSLASFVYHGMAKKGFSPMHIAAG